MFGAKCSVFEANGRAFELKAVCGRITVVYLMLNVTVFAVYYNIYELKAVYWWVIGEVDGLGSG